MIIIIMSIFGMRKGFVESFTDFLNLVVCVIVSLLFYVDLSFFISKYIPVSEAIIIFFSITIIFIFSLLVLRLFSSFLLFLLNGSISSYKILNIVLGFLLGGVKGILSLVLFTGIFEKYISVKLYEILFEQSKILVLLEALKDYIFS